MWHAGDFSVLCPNSPNQPCACPTLSYVNVTSMRNNLLGCYDPSIYFCSTVSPQWLQTPDNYGHTALIQGSGESNVGVCWNQSKPSTLHSLLPHFCTFQHICRCPTLWQHFSCDTAALTSAAPSQSVLRAILLKAASGILSLTHPELPCSLSVSD